MDNPRLGVIGCGRGGLLLARRALTADPGVRLWAVGDVLESEIAPFLKGVKDEAGRGGAKEEGERTDVPQERRFVGFRAYEQVLGSGVDAVILATPPHFRPAHIRAALETGVGVFAETAMAVDGPGVRELRECAALATSRGHTLMGGFCWRASDSMREAMERIERGDLGDVLSAHSTYLTGPLTGFERPRQAGWSDMEFQLRNWLHFAWLSGDHMVEQACHSVDRLLWATGGRLPVRATCLGGRAARSGETSGDVFDHFHVVYEYADGRRTHLSTRQIAECPTDNTDYVHGTLGRASFCGWPAKFRITDDTGRETWSSSATGRDMYQTEMDTFVAAVKNGKAVNEGDRIADVALMAVMARDAAYTGQVVTPEMVMGSKVKLGPEKYEFGPLPVGAVAVPGKTRLG